MIKFNKEYAFVVLIIAFWVGHGMIFYDDDDSENNKIEITTKSIQDISNVPDMIRSWGYPIEEYTVETSDGYILAIHRIPHGRNGTSKSKKRKLPVFLGHCLIGSSATWTFGPPDNSLAFMLADQGYDIWMPNLRGNIYSKKHKTLDTCTECEEYWDFGIEESALIDYPLFIDYILNATGAEQLYFAGFSMGTTQYLMLLSEKPEYNSKFKIGYLLGPTAFGGNVSSIIKPLVNQYTAVVTLTNWLGYHEILPNSPGRKEHLAENFCPSNKLTLGMCLKLITFIAGMKPSDMDMNMVPYYISHIPSGSSARQFVHYFQLFNNGGKFSRYDYGPEENLKKYGNTQPPDYDLDKITAPTVLMSGKGDVMSAPADTDKLADLLPALKYHKVIEDPDWTHMHFIWSKRANTLVYNTIVEEINQLDDEIIV